MIKKIILLSLFSQIAITKNIIWDLGGVLLSSSKFGFVKEVGFRNIVSYAIWDFKNPMAIEELFFSILEDIKIDNGSNTRAVSPTGKPLPPILNAWQAGKLSNTDAKNIILAHIEKLDSQDFFVSRREKKLIVNAVNCTFSPEFNCNNTSIIDQGFNLLKKCAAAVDCCQKPKNKLFILSNWDSETIKLVINKFPELFNLFEKENIIISSDVGLYKPQRDIYKHVIDKFKLDPKECIFIDDQIINVNVANQMGINGIHLKNKNYRNVIRELIRLDAL